MIVALGIAGLVAPVVGALLVASALSLMLGLAFATVAWNWYAGAMLGAMMVLPMGLTFTAQEFHRLLVTRRVAAVLTFALVTVGSVRGPLSASRNGPVW